jgi:hypothetical protein
MVGGAGSSKHSSNRTEVVAAAQQPTAPPRKMHQWLPQSGDRSDDGGKASAAMNFNLSLL